MEDRVIGQHPHANHHSFHIPNAYARSALSSEEEYSAVPGAEEDVEDDDIEGIPSHLTGVEASDTWPTLTRYQRGLVRLAFGILGALVLLPFNTVITPSEYYRALLKGSRRETSFLSWLIAVYNVSCIIFGAHATASMHRHSVQQRIKSSSAVIIAVLILTTSLTSFAGRPEGTDSSGVIFGMMLLLTLTVSAATSYLQIAVVTLANGYGPSCMGSMLSGQGVVGASVSFIQLIAASSASDKSNISDAEVGEAHRAAIGFFAVNTILMILGLAAFLVLERTKLFAEMQSRLMRAKSNLANTLHPSETSPIANAAPSGRSVSGFYRYMDLHTQQTFSRILVTQKKIILACFSIAYIFVVTLSVFPSLTARIHSTHKSLPDIVFVALHFFIFNISDFAGRSLSSIIPRLILIKSVIIIALLSILRTTFIPLLLLCNVTSSSTTTTQVPFGDVAFFLLIVALGISNGMLATNIFIIGPRQDNLQTASEQDLAAGLISWWLTLGLAIGSLASFIVTAYV